MILASLCAGAVGLAVAALMATWVAEDGRKNTSPEAGLPELVRLLD